MDKKDLRSGNKQRKRDHGSLIMAYVITSECIKCSLCYDICPASAIIEGDEQFIITESCIDCGKCVEVCPIDAIRVVKNK